MPIKHKAIQCDNCNYWNHIKCDKIDSNLYETLKNSKEHYICNLCKEEIFPFHKLSNHHFFMTIAMGNIKDFDDNSDLKLFPSPALKSLFDNLNDISRPQDPDEPSSINCEYYEADLNLLKLTKKNMFSLFHMNIASLGLHKEELEDLFSILDIEFDVIGLTETMIEKDITPIYDISLNGYKYFHTPTESKKGGARLYIKDNINCKPRNDLAKEVYKAEKLESIFVEIINKGKKKLYYWVHL